MAADQREPARDTGLANGDDGASGSIPMSEAPKPAPGFAERLERRRLELTELFYQLYDDEEVLERFFATLRATSAARRPSLRALDERRGVDPFWYRSQEIVGMELYPARFAGTLSGLRDHLDYFEDLGINYLYLMAILTCPPGADDGGFAVSDYRAIAPGLGTMDDLDALCDDCAARGIDICLDLALNHTSDQHPWAKAARAGDPEARSRYFFFDDWGLPDRFDQTVPEVFPINAPGNFTYLDDCDKVVMTTFYPYQWDLNYANPDVFVDMLDNLLFLANRGASFIRLNTLPYLWKTIGTSCRSLPQVHLLVRLMRLACEVVCPAVALLGEVVMEPMQVFPYFGRPSAPECQLLYNVTAMCTAWNCVATRDARLLQRQAGQLSGLGPGCAFVNYIRCHDDIGWGLDYPALASEGMQEISHKQYLNEWFTGQWPGSWSRGELYNDDPEIHDARLCGTTASLVGIEAAEEDDDLRKLDRALRRLLMLHAWLLAQSGIPVLYSGDEIAQLNDYGYHDDPEKANDSRYLQRSNFSWEAAARRFNGSTVQGVVFEALRRMIAVRRSEEVFRENATVEVLEGEDNAILNLRRRFGDETLYACFNFSGEDRSVYLPEGAYINLLGDAAYEGDRSIPIPAWGFHWLKQVG